MHLNAVAQVVDPTDPAAVGVTSAQKKKEFNPWVFSASTSLLRGLDYYDKLYSNYGVSGIYRFDERQSLSLNLSYSNPSDLVVTFKEDWGFEDLVLNYSFNRIHKINQKTSMGFRAGLILPTSEKSRNTSLMGGVSLTLPIISNYQRLRFVFTPGARLNAYQYITANKAGTILNYPFSLPVSLNTSYTLTRYLIPSLVLSTNYLFDSEGESINVMGLSANLTVAINNKFSLSTGYRWRDRRLTNYSLFDDDRSSMYLGVTYVQ